MDQEAGQAKARLRLNRIGLETQMAGVAWLQEHREEAGRTPQTELARTLGAALGCKVTVGNLGTMAKAARVPLHGYAREQEVEEQVQKLREAVKELSARVQTIEAWKAAASPVPA